MRNGTPLIDCDVHNCWSDSRELLPFLDPYFRDFLERGELPGGRGSFGPLARMSPRLRLQFPLSDPGTEHLVIGLAGAQCVIEWRSREDLADRTSGKVARSNFHAAELIAIFERTKPPCFVADQRPAQGSCVLLAMKWRSFA